MGNGLWEWEWVTREKKIFHEEEIRSLSLSLSPSLSLSFCSTVLAQRSCARLYIVFVSEIDSRKIYNPFTRRLLDRTCVCDNSARWFLQRKQMSTDPSINRISKVGGEGWDSCRREILVAECARLSYCSLLRIFEADWKIWRYEIPRKWHSNRRKYNFFFFLVKVRSLVTGSKLRKCARGKFKDAKIAQNAFTMRIKCTQNIQSMVLFIIDTWDNILFRLELSNYIPKYMILYEKSAAVDNISVFENCGVSYIYGKFKTYS